MTVTNDIPRQGAPTIHQLGEYHDAYPGPETPAGMSLDERGIFHHVQCHGCGNEAHIVRAPSPAPAYSMMLLSVASTVNTFPRGLADAPGIADAVRLLQEALESFLPDDRPQPDPETPAAAPGAVQAPIGAVWVTVGELIGGRPLPPHPETGAPPCGVAFETIEAEYCTMHLLDELARADALPELIYGATGEVLYRTPTACVACSAEALVE